MPESIHVAIDCRVIDPHFPGIGRATLETVRALAASASPPRLSLITTPEPPHALQEIAATSSHATLVPLTTRLRSPADQWALPRFLQRLRPDVYHATYYAVPVLLPVPTVVTIYDLIPCLFPDYWPNPLTRAIICGWTSYAIRHASRIIACSQNTADDLARLYPQRTASVRVVPLGVTPPPDAAHPSDPPYVLYVGSNKPHKNLPRLVQAFARLDETTVRLVIAGAWDPRYPEALDIAGQAHLGDRIVFEHAPTSERLAKLYSGATAFVFPSLYEGFGLPILEAMAAGIPVATSSRGSLAEVAGDAALLFDSDDESSIADALRRLLTDPTLRHDLVARGQARAALFPWSRTAEQTATVYADIMSESPRP